MCRFLVYRGDPIAADGLLIRSRYSLKDQSQHSRFKITGPLNKDGYGVGWFANGAPPEVFVGTGPAWESTELERVASQVCSGCWFGHVRSASPGMHVTCENAHPFLRRGILWMHNGLVADFSRMKECMFAQMDAADRRVIRGNTDSEVCFALFFSLLARYEGEPVAAMQALFDSIRQWHHELAIEQSSYLNFAATNGDWMVVTRCVTDTSVAPVSLFLAEAVRYQESGGRIQLSKENHGNNCAIVASEPLTEDYCWQEIPSQTLLSIAPSLEIERFRL
ncbi:MAG TPA: class II glutamine amidotransferase [Acidobacteriota bacterium]|jgi:predicted glutamine amidotransferase|nr:class II glutamine amidotransferase [Acidobacteriota bacterium]